MPERTFSYGLIGPSKENAEERDGVNSLFNILTSSNDEWLSSSDGKKLLHLLNKKENFIDAILYSSSRNINIYTINEVKKNNKISYSDEVIEAKLKRNERVVSVMRFVIFKSSNFFPDAEIVLEDVKSPRINYVNDVIYSLPNVSTFPNFIFIPSVNKAKLNQLSAFRIEWNYFKSEPDSKSLINEREKVVGSLSYKKRNKLNPFKIFLDGKKILIKDEEENELRSFDFSDYNGFSISAFIKEDNGTKKKINFASLLIREIKKYKKEDIQNHNHVLEDLHDFYYRNSSSLSDNSFY